MRTKAITDIASLYMYVYMNANHVIGVDKVNRRLFRLFFSHFFFTIVNLFSLLAFQQPLCVCFLRKIVLMLQCLPTHLAVFPFSALIPCASKQLCKHKLFCYPFAKVFWNKLFFSYNRPHFKDKKSIKLLNI